MWDGCKAKKCDVRNKCKRFWASVLGLTNETNNREPVEGGCVDYLEFTEEEIREVQLRDARRRSRLPVKESIKERNVAIKKEATAYLAEQVKKG